MRFAFWILLYALLFGGVVPYSGADLDVEPEIVEFGERWLGESATVQAKLANGGERPVEILDIRPSRLLVASPEFLQPGETGELVLRAPTLKLGWGTTRVFVRWRTEDGAETESRISLIGFVSSAYLPETTRLDFGTVERSTGTTVETELSATTATDLRLVSVEGLPSYLSLQAEPAKDTTRSGLRLLLSVQPNAPFGHHEGSIELVTNLNEQPTYSLSYQLTVVGTIRPTPSTVDLGVLQAGQTFSASVDLSHTTGARFEVVKVHDAEGLLVGSAANCVPTSNSCRRVLLEATPRVSGYVRGTVTIETTAPAETISIPYSGLIAGQASQVADLGTIPPPEPQPYDPVVHGEQAAPDSPVDEGTIRLRWSAFNEKGVFGYLVNRSTERTGPFVRVNDFVVRSQGTELSLHTYEFVDREVEPGVEYFYFLDSVTRQGVKVPFSGVLSKKLATP